MVTLILLTTALAWAPQQSPDSTYLRLVGDLPDAGTFSYDIVGIADNIKMYTELKAVAVERCALSFTVRTRRLTQGTQPRLPPGLWGTDVLIPLNEIDTTALAVRAAHPPRNARYEPQPWLLRVAVKPDTDARIMSSRMEAGAKSPTRRMDLSLRDYDTGALVVRWLKDAASRCETWNTAPLEPIR